MNPTSMLLSFLTLLLASSVFTVDAVENGTQPYSLSVGMNCTGYPSTTNRSWIQVINNSAAEFLSVHFTKFNLPPNDYLIIKATDPHSNETIHTYYTRDIPNTHDFFSTAIIAKSITIQLVTTGDSIGTNVFQCPGFEIDMYRFMADSGVRGREDVCGADNSVEAACAQSSVTPFKRADAVVRLLIHKETASYFCTGWLVGCEGHMITNNHCISTQAHASNTEFEFRAQAGACPDASVPQCNAPLACKGTVRARSSQLIYTSTDLDYTLVKLDINFSNDYGYLQLREAGAAVGDPIYLIGHPAGWGKRIVLKDDTGMGKVISTTQGGCLDNQVAYYLDTLGGSSGSPVLSAIDNSVVALHHCGGCPNTAVNSNKLVADMRARNILPNCAVYSPPTASPTTLPAAPRTAPPTAPPTAPSTAPPTSAPTTTAPPPKPRRSTRVDGTIVTTAMAVTIDYIDFVLTEASTVEVDLLSMEATTTDLTTTSFVDVNGDCNAGYIDSSIVLFKVNPDGSVTESTVVTTNDDAPAGYGKEDGSISSADSYLTLFLSPGRYRVAVGVSSMTTAHAVAKSMPLATTPRVCDTKLSNYGSYRLTLWTTSAVTVTGPNTYIGSQCTGENTVRPYSKCSYHQEAPLAKSVALDGTIVRTGGSVSVDYLPFTMPSFGRITIDLTSFESVDGFTYTDVNGFCTSSYIDAVAYLFRQPTSGTTLVASDIINAADDDDSFVWRPQRMGVSFRDPFLSLALPIGKYMLVVGRYPMTLQAAIDKINTASPGLLTPESCGDIATQGNYRVTIASARDLSASAAGTFVGVKCQGNKGKQLCAGQ